MSKKVNSSIPSHLKYNKSLPNIPHYAKKYRDEYKFIKSIEKDLEYFIDNIDDVNKGLFNSSKAKEINEKIRIFIRGQEIGRFNNLNGLEIKETDISNLIKIKKKFDCWKRRYNACNGVDSDDSDEDCSNVNEVVYTGFGELYNLLEIFFNKLVIWHNDSDSYCDSDIEYEIKFSDSDSDSDSDSE